MVEQRSPKPTVEGSSPSAPANEKQRPLLGVFLFLGLLWLSFRHFLSSFLLSFCPFLFSSLLFSSFPCLYRPYGCMAGFCVSLLQASVLSLPPVVTVWSLHAVPSQVR